MAILHQWISKIISRIDDEMFPLILIIKIIFAMERLKRNQKDQN